MQWSPARLTAALEAMERAGLNRSAIADMAGRHRSQVSRWFQGQQRPDFETAMQLAKQLRSELPELADEFLSAAGYADGANDDDDMPPSLHRALVRWAGEDDAAAVRDFLRNRRHPGPASGS